MVIVLLWMFAFVFFVLATIGIPCPPRFNFLAAGLTCIALAGLIGGMAGVLGHADLFAPPH